MKRRTARTVVVWIALLLLIASWIYTYLNPQGIYLPGSPILISTKTNWTRLVFMDLTILALAAGFLFTFRGKDNG